MIFMVKKGNKEYYLYVADPIFFRERGPICTADGIPSGSHVTPTTTGHVMSRRRRNVSTQISLQI